jgi:ectoine hydroxylase-related dioxygenase (phytanoyl-CoA dioxygenase family)
VFGATDDSVAKALSDAIEFRDACAKAELPGQIPAIRVSASEQHDGVMGKLRRRLAVKLFREYGTLLIENAFSDHLVEQMHQEYLDRYQRYFADQRHGDALTVGDKRFMVTVDVDGPFNSPQVYANPHVKPIISDILGENMIMGGFVSVCSLPGAEPMRVHKDHPALFPESDNPDGLPSCAVTAIVPMLGFNAVSGTTRVVKRSHQCSSKKAAEMEYQDPTAPRGSCLLMDYRLTHQGRGNQSDKVRPILTMIYHRPWFRDIVNYGKQEPLLMSDQAFQQVPEEHRPLFAWAQPKKQS